MFDREIAWLRVVARLALRYFWVWLAVLVLACVVTVSAGMDIYHRTEVPRFCGACHEMSGNFASWERSRHTSIKCVDCHARPGFWGWQEAKRGGLRQLMKHFSAGSISDIRMGEEQRRIISENCRRCHPGSARLEEREGIATSHGRHLEGGIECATCHSRAFAHPGPGLPVAPLVDKTACVRCHDGTAAGEAAAATTGRSFSASKAFAAGAERSCTRCHRDAGVANQHGAVENECTNCHEPERAGHFPAPGLAVGEICANCHDREQGHASAHKAYTEGRCGECHKVMSPAHLFLAGSKPSAATCIACHEDTGNGFVDGDRDLHALHAERLAEDPGWCLRCHAAHGSPAKRAMVRLQAASGIGAFEATPSGGGCSGACHGEVGVTYSRGAR